MSCLLVRQIIDSCISELEKFVRRNRVQVRHNHRSGHCLPTSFNLNLYVGANAFIENSGQRNELGDQVAINSQQNVTGFQKAVRRRIRNDLLNRQHAGLIWKLGSNDPLRLVAETKTFQLIVGLHFEHCLQGAAGHGLFVLNQVERTINSIEREKETARGRVVRTRIEGHDFAINIYDR